MKIYVIQAAANRNELDGTATFLHKRAFVDKARADAFAPEFAKSIAEDRSGLSTYCNVEAEVTEIELVTGDEREDAEKLRTE